MMLLWKIVMSWVLFVFGILLRCQCDAMEDPYDMFEIFNDQREFGFNEDPPPNRDLTTEKHTIEKKLIGAPLSCMRSTVPEETKSCSEFIKTLLKNVVSQLPTQQGERNADASVRFSLTSSDVQTIIKYSESSKISTSQICDMLRDSIERASSIGMLSRFLYSFGNILSYFRDNLLDLKIYFSTPRLTLMEFVVLSWALVFISCLFFLFVLRKSVVFMVTWIFICVLFLTTYTTYHKKYQEAVAEREALLLAHRGMELPAECVNLVKSRIHKFIEYFTGPYPASLSEGCKSIFKKMNIDPEVEIKLMDAFSESLLSIIDKVVLTVFDSASNTSERAKQKYGWMVGWLVFGITLIFFFLVIAQMMGREVSTMFFTVRSRPDNSRQGIPYHREFIETVPSPQPVGGSIHLLNDASASVSAELIHQLLEKQAKSIKNKRKKHSQQDEPEQNDDFTSATSDSKGCRPAYKKIYSAINLKPSSMKELTLRRSSF